VVPLTALLLLAGPRTGREWWWIALGTAWTVVWWMAPGSLAEQLIKAWGVVIAGCFVALALGREAPAGRAALLAPAIAAAAFAAVLPAWGLTLRMLEFAVTRELWQGYRFLLSPDLGLSPQLRDLVLRMSETATSVAAITPAGLFLGGALGLALAWQWSHRLAERPLGAPLPPFERFRFSDHLVWLLVVAIATVLGQRAGVLAAGSVPLNLLLVMGGLYLARGVAILWPGLLRLPLVVRGLWVVVSVMFLPFAVSGLLGIGLADTWIDFRRRRDAPAHGG
jgi:hypothetical protein